MAYLLNGEALLSGSLKHIMLMKSFWPSDILFKLTKKNTIGLLVKWHSGDSGN
jgi:hypothetical protein